MPSYTAQRSSKGCLLAVSHRRVVYVAADVISSLRYEGYEYHGQAISELAAVGAPSRPLFVAFMLAYNALLLAFTAGIWRTAHGKRAVYYMVAAFVANVAVGMFGLLLFNMDQRGAEETFRGSLHGPATLVESVFIMASMAFAAAAYGKTFRVYSIVTIVVLIVFGIWTSFDITAISNNEATPWMGIKERINVYAYLLWVAVLAVLLWRRGRPHPHPSPDELERGAHSHQRCLITGLALVGRYE